MASSEHGMRCSYYLSSQTVVSKITQQFICKIFVHDFLALRRERERDKREIESGAMMFNVAK